MNRAAIVLLAFATLATGCAGMGTKRGQGAQIQRTAQPVDLDRGSLDTASPDARPDLGQR